MSGGSLAIYARVSTGKQTVAQQLDRLRSAAPGAREFVDEAMSGRSEDRPAFLQLRAAIERGEISAVYAVTLDRLGRSARSILEFFELAQLNDVRVVLVDQAVDTSTSAGRVVRTVLAGMAELEADLARERTQEAMDAIKSGDRATRSGKSPGRPRKVQPRHVQQIVELRETRKPNGEVREWNEVAKEVQIPASTCRKVYSAWLAEKARVVNPSP